MPEYVRVRVNNREATVTSGYAERHDMTVLDAAATDAGGTPLPESRANGRRVKPRTSVDEQAAKRTTKETTANKAARKSTSGGESASTSEE